MQPTPKKIKPTTNQDYASIYEDNFIKTNNPAQLGQQAFTRQLSQGINNKLNPTQTGFAGIQCQEGYYFDSTKGACVPYSNEIMAYNNEVITNETRGGQTRPGFFEKVGDAVRNAFNNSESTYYSGLTNLTPEQEQAVQQTRTDAANVGAFVKDPQKAISTGITDTMFEILGGKEEVVKDLTDAAMPALQEADQYISGDKNFLEDVVGVEIPDFLKNKNPTTVFDDYENAFSEDTGPSLPETPTETPTTTTTTTGAGAQTRTGKPGATGQDELGLADDVQTGDQTGEVLPTVNQTPPTPGAEEVGSGTVDDAKTRVSNSVQTRVDDLTNNLNQRINQAEQFYAREYDRILNQIAMRARQSQVGGFTGGIQEQINQFASAAEIQQLNALAVERNNTIQSLEAERANIPMQAQQYANELLTAELQNENIRTQALSTLYTDVLNGVRTIEEAQAFADQYGLGNIQELMDRVQTVQAEQILASNPNVNEKGEIVPHTIESLRALYEQYGITKTDAELQEILDGMGKGVIDFTSLEEREALIATELSEVLDTTNKDGATTGLISGLITAGIAAMTIPGPGWIVGLISIGAGLIVGSVVNNEIPDQEDVNKILSDFGNTSLFTGTDEADVPFVNTILSGEGEITLKDPSAMQNEAPSGYGFLNDTYTMNFMGTDHKMKGHQIMTLAVILNNKGVLDNYPALKAKAEVIYKSMPTAELERLFGEVSTKEEVIAYNFYKATFNK